jgi:arylsulfatase A-like enzyme
LPPIQPPPVKVPVLPPLPAGPPPNIIVMLIDDMGWTDLGCYGSNYYETPHIDQLAKDGMRFTQAYSACTVCSPTRAAMLTGKSPARLHITDWIAGHVPDNSRLVIPKWTLQLPMEEETLAERLKTRGYATASIGKWHLGGEEFYPTKHGFDVNIAGTDKGSPPSYFSPYKIATLPDGPSICLTTASTRRSWANRRSWRSIRPKKPTVDTAIRCMPRWSRALMTAWEHCGRS